MFGLRSVRSKITQATIRKYKVTVVRASGGIGQPLSLSLKLDNNVTQLSLYDVNTPGCRRYADISHINSSAKTKGFVTRGMSPNDISTALHDIKQKLVAWEVKPPPMAELRSCQQVLDSVLDAVSRLAQDHHNSLAELSNLRETLESEIASRIALESRLGAVEKELTTLEKEFNALEKEKETQHKIMLIRQIASAYQHKAAKFCGVGKQGKQFCITHEQLSKSADSSKFQKIEDMFQSEGLTDTSDINLSVKIVRELGFSTSHPSSMISGGAATYPDLVEILDSAGTAGLLSDLVVSDAKAILNVTSQLHNMLGLHGDLLDTTV
jgi:hypothetical protein